MKLSIYFSCLILINVFNYIYGQCVDRGVSQSLKIREYFYSTSVDRCREWTIGRLDNVQKNILVLFEASGAYIDCTSDNILILNDRKVPVLDYCQSRSRISEGLSVFAIVTGRNAYVQYNYGGSGMFSVQVDAFLIDIPSLSVSTTSSAVTTRPVVTTATNPIVTTTTTATTTTTTTTTTSASSNGTCGEPAIPMNQNGFRIVGGGVAAPNSHPWQAYVTDSRLRMTCGGSLINNQWVITAAHCVDSPTTYRVFLGAHDLARTVEPTRLNLAISKVVLHASYDLTGRLENDIALLKLERPIQFTKEITPICLPRTTPAANTQAIVTGWGLTRDGGAVSKLLNQVAVSVRDQSFCRSVGISGSSQLCAGNTIASNGAVKDSCQGDSGGPLITGTNNKYVLNGIVSYGGSSCNGIGVYTNVASFINWIDTNMRNN